MFSACILDKLARGKGIFVYLFSVILYGSFCTYFISQHVYILKLYIKTLSNSY